MSRRVRWVFFVLFLLGVAVQYNDPDIHLWVGIYGAAAALTFDSLRGRFPLACGGAYVLGCLIYAVQLTVRVIRNGNFSDPVWGIAEEGREFLGLYGIAAWTAYLLVSSRRQQLS